jgi:hypothetical protein
MWCIESFKTAPSVWGKGICVQEWEYKVVGTGFRMGRGMEKLLTEHGREGRELVFIEHQKGLLVFKRPVG